MITANIITGIINCLTYMALMVTVASPQNFLSALFLYASSIFSEALSLRSDARRPKSWMVSSCIFFLFVSSVVGAVFSVAGLAGFVNVRFEMLQSGPINIIVSPILHSALYFPETNIGIPLFWGGIFSICIPFIIAIRGWVVDVFVKNKYNLKNGLYGK